MDDDIRESLRPFATELGSAPIHRLDSLESDDVLLHMSITRVTGTIYDDGDHRLTVPAWTYSTQAAYREGHAGFPSTGLVVRRNQTVRVDWHNDTTGADSDESPIDEVVVPYAADDTTTDSVRQVPQNMLGLNGIAAKHKPKARFITHLHGGRVAPSSDGWPESMSMPGQTLRDCYENRERATMHWFHDHAMHTTAGNVFAGLAAPYIIRDDEESALDLPSNDDELVLVIQDRNLSVEYPLLEDAFSQPGAVLETRFLRKVESQAGPLEFFGPLTLVNGRLWPNKAVPARWQRVRILNGSNSRTYALQFVRTDEQGQVARPACRVDLPVKQIGADGGLLARSIDLGGTDEPIVLMPAQRIDLLVDFRALAGERIALINLAKAPFDGSYRPLDNAFPEDPVADSEYRTPYPEVMRFDIQACPDAGQDYTDIDQRLAACVDLAPHLPSAEKVTTERVIGLLEKDMGAAGNMLVTLELLPDDDLPDYQPKDKARPRQNLAPYQALLAGRRIIIDGRSYRVCAERFQDPVNFHIKYGATERWRFVNLSPDSHPMHLHLVQYLHEKTTPIQQVYEVDHGGKAAPAASNSDPDFNDRLAGIVNGAFVNDRPVAVTLAPNAVEETNEVLRDTVRVDPGTVVDIIARFEGHHGRYLYHCHLLEHEDHDMMRQYVVTRNDLAHESDGDRKDAPPMASIGK